jgi:hypothetical protein
MVKKLILRARSARKINFPQALSWLTEKVFIYSGKALRSEALPE